MLLQTSDPNTGSSFTYTWGDAYNTLPGVIDNGSTLSFDPSTMDSGVISVSVEVSDGVNTTMASILLNIVLVCLVIVTMIRMVMVLMI